MRENRSRSRTWIFIGVGVTAIAVGVTVAVVASRSEPTTVAAPTVAPITASDPSASVAPVEPPTVEAIAPGDIVATIKGDTVGVYDNAGDATPRENLGRFSYYGNVRTFMGLETVDVDGDQWIHVQLPEYPNNSTGWVKAAEVTTDSTDLLVNVYLDEREVDLVESGDVQLTSTAVIGAEESPTPLGAYFIADPVDFTADPSGTYGAFALGLSAYSETLETFKGALPQIALHGTNTDKYFGEAVSNGCVRLPDDTIRELAQKTALGTPVVIHQSRAEAAA
jgi:lipoprotein-anchoring transpeptidase ErfK/SrfK